MRNCNLLAAVVVTLIISLVVVGKQANTLHNEYTKTIPMINQFVSQLGLSDLVLTTEARYTRHPSTSDTVAPFMDHPFDLEHFPSGSFFHPLQR